MTKLQIRIIDKCNFYYGVNGVIGKYGEWYYDKYTGFTCDNAHWSYCTREIKPKSRNIVMINLDHCPLDLAYDIATFFKE